MIDFPIHGSKWFDTREWVDERTWSILGPNAAYLIEPRTIRIADLLREKAGSPIVINNWHYWRPGLGSKYRSSGFRAKWDKTGGELSQHRRGCAGDHKSTVYTPAKLLQIIMDNKSEFLELGLTTIEDLINTPTWLHLDSRPRLEGLHIPGEFLFVKPV